MTSYTNGEKNVSSSSPTLTLSTISSASSPRDFPEASSGRRYFPFGLIHKCGTCMTRSRAFKTLVDKAFDVCDDSKDGTIDEAELYAGLLLVHLQLAKHAGPAACFPPTRQVCDRLFHAADADNVGGLDKEEFRWIMQIMCGEILTRMFIFYVIMVLGVPVLGSVTVRFLGAPEGGYLEDAIRVCISICLLFLVIPLLWEVVDECFEQPKNLRTSEPSEALLLPSKREQQRQRRRLRRNKTSQQDGKAAIGN